MNCTVVYGLGRNLQHAVDLPVAEAFRKLRDNEYNGWAFIDIYYNDRLIYTTQGVAGYRYICPDCPYKH